MSSEAVPGLDLDEFSSLVRTAFLTTKRAWAQLKPDICRHVMTEDLWAQQKARMEAVQLDGSRNVVSGLIISRIEIQSRRSEGLEDEVRARLIVAGTDYILQATTNRVMTGSRGPDQWVEDWVMRRSRDSAALSEAENRRCPNCGAPVSVDPEGHCTFCHAVLPGAKSDWLASAIDRPAAVNTTALVAAGSGIGAIHGDPDADTARAGLVGQYAPAAALADPAAAAGIAAIRSHDPAFTVGDLLAVSRELFLDIEQCRTMMDPSPVRAYISDGLWQAEVTRSQAARRAGRNQVRAFLDIRSMVVAEAGSDAGGDRLTVKVTAQSADHLIDTASGELIAGDNNLVVWTEQLVFVRGPGLTSSPLRGVEVHECPSCGAPFDVGGDGSCRACGKHITGGEFDWILWEIQAPATLTPTTAPA